MISPRHVVSYKNAEMTTGHVHVPSERAALDAAEIRRYGRHLILPQVGMEGQERLKASRVLLVGAGGLGSPLGLYLAAAGVGTLGLVDFDRVEESNLQRQVLFGQSDLGRPKVEAGFDRLREVNPHIDLRPHATRLSGANALDLLADYDVVADGSDNFQTRYLVNDACVLAGKPDVWGAISRFEGQASVFWSPRGPCYRCLFPEPPPPGLVQSCAEAGVLGVLPGIIGALQANEVVKLILGIGEPLLGRLVIFDALGLRFREMKLERSPDCPMCGVPEDRRELVEYPPDTCDPPGAETRSAADEAGTPDRGADLEDLPFEIDVEDLERWRGEGREIVLLDVREPHEYSSCHIAGSRLLPLREIPHRWQEIDSETLTVVHCHHGPRSSQAVVFLRRQGLDRVTNLRGGIDAWSLRVDPGVPRY